MSAAIAASLFGSPLESRARESLARILSTRELEILAMVADGKNTAHMADQLVISPAEPRLERAAQAGARKQNAGCDVRGPARDPLTSRARRRDGRADWPS